MDISQRPLKWPRKSRWRVIRHWHPAGSYYDRRPPPDGGVVASKRSCTVGFVEGRTWREARDKAYAEHEVDEESGEWLELEPVAGENGKRTFRIED